MRVSWLSAGEASPTISLRCVLKGGASPGKSAMYGGSENTAQMRLERHPSPAPIIWAPVKVHPWPHSAASPLRKKGLPCMPIEARSSHESQERTFCTRLASAPQFHVLASSMRKSMNALVRFIYFWPLGLLRYISKISRS